MNNLGNRQTQKCFILFQLKSNMQPRLSKHFQENSPSSIRLAQIEFLKRTDNVQAINLAIGNVSLPMHPKMQERMFNLKQFFKDGVVKYTPSAGTEECKKAFLNILSSSNCPTENLFCQITDGGSQAMELVILGTAESDKPLLLLEPAYTNYLSFAKRTQRKTISISRTLSQDGKFTLPNLEEIEEKIKQHSPSSLIIIPYDNPTGQFYSKQSLIELSNLCVKYNMWIVSDEAYRELSYTDSEKTSIWHLTEKDVPGITRRRISIETASKVWNACGLRIGAIITDNKLFHEKSVAEYTANLCANTIGQSIFSSLANISHSSLQEWYSIQRNYYKQMIFSFTKNLKSLLPDLIISSPDAAIYSVIDVRNIVPKSFNAKDFVLFCAKQGKVSIDKKDYTLLVSPMDGFYTNEELGKTQMRIAYVETPENMKLAPILFSSLLKDYLKNHSK